MSFAPITRGVDPRIRDSMTVSSKDVKKLRAGDWGFVKRLQANAGCNINIPDDEYPREDPHEFGC